MQFYFLVEFGQDHYPLAMISMFSLPNTEILNDSSETVYLCEPMTSEEGLVVLPVNAILSVVSMFPELQVTQDRVILDTGKFSLMYHMFIGLAHITDEILFEGDNEELHGL